MVTLILTVVLACCISGNCLVLKQKTLNVVRVREGDTLMLEAEVDSHELNLRFTGPGNKPLGYGYDDHRATDGYEVLNFTDTGYLFSVWLTIEHVDRFQSGRYFLTGFDAYSWERCSWMVVVQVVPLRHVAVTSLPTCYVSEDDEQHRCGRYTEDNYVLWEYFGCNVTVRDTGDVIISEFDQCEGLHEADDEEKIDLLYHATKHGLVQQASMLVMLGSNVNWRYVNGLYPEETALCIAARLGHVKIMELLLNSGASLGYEHREFYPYTISFVYEMLPSYPITALDCAARSGSVALVEKILARIAHLRSKNSPLYREADSSFLHAAMSGSLTLVKQYISWGSDWKLRDREGRTAIFFAALSGSLQLVKFFQSLGLDVHAKDSDGRSILFYAARSDSVELVEYLVQAGLQPLEENFAGETPIVQAVLGGSIPVFGAFLKWRGSVFYTNSYRQSLLHYAAIMGHVAMVEKLVSIGLRINATDAFKETPLHYAAEYNRPSVVRTLISLRGNIEARNYLGLTPLHTAAYYLNPLCVELLLSAGANAGAVGGDGRTALHLVGRRISFGRYPLQPDMLLNVKGEQGEVPLYKTWQARNSRLIVLLLEAYANANAEDRHGRTPLHFIVKERVCKPEHVQLLVKAGVDPNKEDKYGETALHRATLNNKLSCVRALVEVGASTSTVTKNTLLESA